MKNIQTTALVTELKKLAIERQRPFWKRIASDLEKPSRRRRIVNLWKVEQFAKDGETIIVPGKLLGDGTMTKKITIAAASCSTDARNKVMAAGGKILSIQELSKAEPDGKDIRVIG